MRQGSIHGASGVRIQERPLGLAGLANDQVYVETEVTAVSTGTELGYEAHSVRTRGGQAIAASVILMPNAMV